MTQSDGAESPRRDEWIAFLENAIGALRLASDDLRRNPDDFHARIDWFRKKNPTLPRENSVSRALAELMRKMQSRQAISGSGPSVPDLRNITIECERPRPFDPGISDMAKPTDIAITLYKDGELDLRIEAKSVFAISDLTAYSGANGLLRFENASNPYTIAPFGAMIAYVIDDDAATWDRRVASAVETVVGKCRICACAIGAHWHSVSRHEFVHVLRGVPKRYSVDVIHMAIEVDAVPSKRSTAAGAGI